MSLPKQGHITPLSQLQLHRAFAEAGFTTLWLGSFGEGRGRLGGSPRLQQLARLVALFAIPVHTSMAKS